MWSTQRGLPWWLYINCTTLMIHFIPLPYFILLQSFCYHWTQCMFLLICQGLTSLSENGLFLSLLDWCIPIPVTVSGTQKPLSNTCWMNQQRQMSLLSESLYSIWRRQATNKKQSLGKKLEPGDVTESGYMVGGDTCDGISLWGDDI